MASDFRTFRTDYGCLSSDLHHRLSHGRSTVQTLPLPYISRVKMARSSCRYRVKKLEKVQILDGQKIHKTIKIWDLSLDFEWPYQLNFER